MGVGSYLRYILYFISSPTMVYHAKPISTGLGVLAGLWLSHWLSLWAYELRAWVMQGADGLA